MSFEDFSQKPAVTIVYTGEGKGKTSASLGLMARALGYDWRVAFIQFIKDWEVGEHRFIKKITPLYEQQLFFFKGGKGFYNAGDLSAEHVTRSDHKKAALATFKAALECVTSGEYRLVICDEINNAVNDELLSIDHLEQLLKARHANTSLCMTGRQFPAALLDHIDIATDMRKIKHHYDDKFLANEGIDY